MPHDQRRARPRPNAEEWKRVTVTRQVSYATEAYSRARPRGPGGAVAQGTASATRTRMVNVPIASLRRAILPIAGPNALPELTGAENAPGCAPNIQRDPKQIAEALTQYRIQHADTEYVRTHIISENVCGPAPCHHALHPTHILEPELSAPPIIPISLPRVLEVPNSSALSVTRTPYTQCKGNPRRLRTRHNHKAHYVKHSPPLLPALPSDARGRRPCSVGG